jgi:uncharacterized protein YbjQ (UPF0145 family)
MTQNEMLIASSEQVAGRTIMRTLGLVQGNSVQVRNVGRDIQASIRTVFGGRVGVYSELLEKSREEAIGIMVEAARARGANAVVAVRLATAQVMRGAAEVLAYGTAVILQ